MAKSIKKAKPTRKKYMLVEIGWDPKTLRAAAAAMDMSSARFAQTMVKNGVERFKTRQLRAF